MGIKDTKTAELIKKENPPQCGCGCGQPVTVSVRAPYGWNKFLKGHKIYPDLVVDGQKECTKCHIKKDVSEFSPKKTGKNKLHTWCKSCNWEQTQIFYKKNPDKFKVRRRKEVLKKYDLTIEQYEEMLANQGNACAICGKKEFRKGTYNMPVDHCHKTGKTRKILCNSCNRGIGFFGDSPDILQSAIDYLKSFQDSPQPSISSV